jgi:hypothetical protein
MVFKKPLAWPQGYKRTVSRKSALFGAKRNDGNGFRSLNMADATKRLHEELARLGVRDFDVDVVIYTNLNVGVSGLPRSDQGDPADPGVVVFWEVNGKPRNMPIDIYSRVADNIAAVAATLKAMRDIERHGGKVIQDKAMEAFDALPAPDSCWQILNMHLLPDHQRTKEVVVNYFKEQATKLLDHRGMPMDMNVLRNARDEALSKIRGE